MGTGRVMSHIRMQAFFRPFANCARAGEPDFTKLKHEVENDPVVVLERLNRNRKILPQRKLASHAGFANQQTIDRFRTVKNKNIDKIRRMTVVLGLFTGLGRKIL